MYYVVYNQQFGRVEIGNGIDVNCIILGEYNNASDARIAFNAVNSFMECRNNKPRSRPSFKDRVASMAKREARYKHLDIINELEQKKIEVNFAIALTAKNLIGELQS